MRIAVFGAGGVGGYFGGRLAQLGADVTFIARGAHLEAIRAHGLQVDSVKGNFVVHPAKATDAASDVGVVDYVLVAVKAWNVPEVAAQILPLLTNTTAVIPLENGVEAPAQLLEVLGRDVVLGGLCKIFSYVAGPGHIVHGGVEPSIAFGELDNRKTERAERLREVFQKAEVLVEIPADIQVAMWEKFLFISSVSGVGAVCRAPIGIIRSVPESRKMIEQAMSEVFAVAAARSVFLPADTVQRAMQYVDNIPPEGTASMQRDVMEGRPSELEYQSGTVVRFGEQLGVDVSVHKFIYSALLPSEQKARRKLL